jgi:hypothetical protein
MRSRLAQSDPRFFHAVPQYDPFRPGDIRFSCASIEKARRMLSFAPTHDVAEGLGEALDWYVGKAHATTAQHGAIAPHVKASAVSLPQFDGGPLTVAAS